MIVRWMLTLGVVIAVMSMFKSAAGIVSDVVSEHSLMVRWVVGSILHVRPIELFLVLASDPRMVYQRLWYVPSCLWDGAYKRTLTANWKE